MKAKLATLWAGIRQRLSTWDEQVNKTRIMNYYALFTEGVALWLVTFVILVELCYLPVVLVQMQTTYPAALTIVELAFWVTPMFRSVFLMISVVSIFAWVSDKLLKLAISDQSWHRNVELEHWIKAIEEGTCYETTPVS